jgi:hypothetical protein
MRCEELVSGAFFVDVEGSIEQQAMPDRSIARREQRIGGDADTPEEPDVVEDPYELTQSD